MELIYKIEFNTTNSYYKDIIIDLINVFKINAKCKQYLDFILIIFNDEKNKIDNFFTLMEEKLPLSIFLGKTEAISSYDKNLEELEKCDVKLNLSLFTNDEIDTLLKNSNIDFSNDINKIKDGGISRLETSNGLKNIFLPSFAHKENFERREHEVRLLITNINKVSEILDISEDERRLICTIERPLVKVRLKKDANKDKIYSNTDFIYVKIADDKESVLFSSALNNVGIYYLMFVADEIYQNALKVISFNEQNIIINGDKGLFPKIDYITKEKYYSAKNYFDSNKGVFNSILQKHHRDDKNFLGIYFSLDSKESSLKIKKDSEIIDILKIPNIKNNFLHYLDKTSLTCESSKEMILTYKEKFSSYFTNLDFDNNSNSFKTILNHIALVLGLKNYKDINDLSLTCENEKMDVFEINTILVNNKSYLDFREVLLNIMKLKLSGFTNEEISYTFFKSLSLFVCKNIKENTSTDTIILCGNLFSNKVLLKYTYKYLDNKYKIILPKAYPLDY